MVTINCLLYNKLENAKQLRQPQKRSLIFSITTSFNRLLIFPVVQTTPLTWSSRRDSISLLKKTKISLIFTMPQSTMLWKRELNVRTSNRNLYKKMKLRERRFSQKDWQFEKRSFQSRKSNKQWQFVIWGASTNWKFNTRVCTTENGTSIKNASGDDSE